MAWLLVAYHAFNVYTDVKWRITKNLWHLLFFLGGVMLSGQALRGEGIKEILTFYALSVILWLCIGIFMETAVGMFSPGDTKMIVVSALWLAASAGERYRETLLSFGFGVCMSLLIAGLIVMIRNHGIKQLVEEFKSQLFFWLTVGMNPFRAIEALKAMKRRVRDEQNNPMKSKNIPAAIPIAAGTFLALMT